MPEPARKRPGRPPEAQPAAASAFARAVRAARTERELTQEGLAAQAGLTAATINQIERGRQGPSLETAQKLARLLGLSLDALAGG